MVRYGTLLHRGIDLHNLAWRRGGWPPHHREVRLSLGISWCWSEAWERSIVVITLCRSRRRRNRYSTAAAWARRRPLTAVLRVVLRIVTAPLHMRWAEDVRLVCCRGRSSSPPLGLASYHDRGRGDRNMSRIWCAPLGHHMPLLPPPPRGRFIAKMVSMSRTLARRVQSKTQGHMLWP